MATYSFPWLIMGRVKKLPFLLSPESLWIFEFFTEMFIEQSSTVHTTFVQITQFDWLTGQLKELLNLIGWGGNLKGWFFKNIFKNLLLWNQKEDEAETWHTCLGHNPLQKLCSFYFQCPSAFIAITTWNLHRLIMGKVEIGTLYCLIWDNWIYFYRNVFWIVLPIS